MNARRPRTNAVVGAEIGTSGDGRSHRLPEQGIMPSKNGPKTYFRHQAEACMKMRFLLWHDSAATRKTTSFLEYRNLFPCVTAKSM